MKPEQKIANSNATLAKRVRAARDRIEEIEGREELAEAAKRERIVEARKWLLEQVDEIEASAKSTLDEARLDLESLTLSPGEGTEAIRARDRVKALFDRGVDPTSLAHQLAAAGDRTGLAVLREELPAWNQLAGQNSSTRGALASIRDAERQFLGEKAAKRQDAVAEAERAFSMVQTNAGLTRIDAEATEALYGNTAAEKISLAA